ncbi:MAG: NAD(P)-dependent oxidoreductase [Elusimicrobia bacterium]|nr:NAD(P)-dependent oxidoreductase [Elusimicrobiota bacterium]
MTVLVTGGAGYVGSVLTGLLLEKGCKARVLDALLHGGQALLGAWGNPNFDFVRGDIRDIRLVEQCLEGVDAVVHLAAIVGDPACAREPDTARAVNLGASLELWKASQRQGVPRFIFASTCSNYGRMNDSSKYVDETSELRPVSLYAETKVAVENAILKSYPEGRTSPTILRFATVFGVSPRMRFDLTVNEFVAKMILEKNLTVFGEQFWRPYIHVKDVARAVTGILESPLESVGGRVFNVGSTQENYQKKQLVDLIQPYAPQARISYVHKQEDPRDYRVSFERIASDLGFKPLYTVEDGIRQVADLVNSGLVTDPNKPEYQN